jgi:anti-sigma B factor antagonist
MTGRSDFDPNDHPAGPAAWNADSLGADSRAWALQTLQALEQLPEPARSALRLVYWRDLTPTEAAQQLGVDQATLNACLAAALRELAPHVISMPDASRVGGWRRSAFSVQVDPTSAASRLLVSGEIDLSVSPRLADFAIHCITAGAADQVVIDLGAVTFLDSAALAALVAVRRAALALGREVILDHVSEHGRRLLNITGLDQVFTIWDTVDLTPPTSESVI